MFTLLHYPSKSLVFALSVKALCELCYCHYCGGVNITRTHCLTCGCPRMGHEMEVQVTHFSVEIISFLWLTLGQVLECGNLDKIRIRWVVQLMAIGHVCMSSNRWTAISVAWPDSYLTWQYTSQENLSTENTVLRSSLHAACIKNMIHHTFLILLRLSLTLIKCVRRQSINWP